MSHETYGAVKPSLIERLTFGLLHLRGPWQSVYRCHCKCCEKKPDDECYTLFYIKARMPWHLLSLSFTGPEATRTSDDNIIFSLFRVSFRVWFGSDPKDFQFSIGQFWYEQIGERSRKGKILSGYFTGVYVSLPTTDELDTIELMLGLTENGWLSKKFTERYS